MKVLFVLISSVAVLVAISITIYLIKRNGGLRTPTIPAERLNLLKVALGLVACHLLAWYFWPEVWWALAKTFVFWLDHVVLVVVTLFLLKQDKTSSVWAHRIGVTLLALLIMGNVQLLVDWWEKRVEAKQEQMRILAEDFAMSEASKSCTPLPDGTYAIVAPVKGRSCRVPFTEGWKVKPGGLVNIWNASGRPYQDGPGMKTEMPESLWLEFQSGTGAPVNVTSAFNK